MSPTNLPWKNSKQNTQKTHNRHLIQTNTDTQQRQKLFQTTKGLIWHEKRTTQTRHTIQLVTACGAGNLKERKPTDIRWGSWLGVMAAAPAWASLLHFMIKTSEGLTTNIPSLNQGIVTSNNGTSKQRDTFATRNHLNFFKPNIQPSSNNPRHRLYNTNQWMTHC